MGTTGKRNWGHILYQSVLALIVIIVTLWLGFEGYDYYQTPLEERFYHEHHEWFKASGLFGHGLGIIGTALITVGVFLYIPAKKYGFLEKYIRLRYLLEFHIFLCTLGPILILFHTTFKFGGIVSIAFWSMVLVVLSGVVGRYIYLQIPRSISGRELSRQELKEEQERSLAALAVVADQAPELYQHIREYQNDEKGYFARRTHFRNHFNQLKSQLGALQLDAKEHQSILSNIKAEMVLQQRIHRLALMQKLFKYWHVAHRPVALIMLLVVIIHIGVTMAMGYTWIF